MVAQEMRLVNRNAARFDQKWRLVVRGARLGVLIVAEGACGMVEEFKKFILRGNPAAEPPEDVKLLAEIRDLLKAQAK
jgi:hypothetical protein